MSIAALIRDEVHPRANAPRAAVRKPSLLLRGRAEGDSAALAAPARSDAITGLITDLTRYIPSEAIAAYAAVLPFLLPDEGEAADYTSRWILVAAVAVVAVLYAGGVRRAAARQAQQPFTWPTMRIVLLLIAFIGWTAVIPGSPFGSFGWYTPETGAVFGLATNVALNLLVLWFGPLPES